MTKEQLEEASEMAARIISSNVDPEYKDWMFNIIYQQFSDYVEKTYEYRPYRGGSEHRRDKEIRR